MTPDGFPPELKFGSRAGRTHAEPTSVPVMDEPTEFTAESIHRLDHAWEVVQHFARTGDLRTHDQWQEP